MKAAPLGLEAGSWITGLRAWCRQHVERRSEAQLQWQVLLWLGWYPSWRGLGLDPGFFPSLPCELQQTAPGYEA